MYKKKQLNFMYNEVSRTNRLGETLKARESSRFKRLSMLRNLESEDQDKSVKITECNGKNKPSSRLEMLFKWKQEKKVKQELEKKKVKPFYVGGQIKNIPYKEPLVAQPRFHSSKIAKSRLVTPSTQPVKTVNISKQPAAGASAQSSRIPNHLKMTGARTNMSSKNPKTTRNPVISSAGQESTLPKQNFTKQQSKSVKTGIPTMSKGNSAQKDKNQSGIPSFSSNPSKGISAQKSKNQVAPCLKNVTNRKNIGMKKIPNFDSEKKVQENKSDTNCKINKVESMSEQSLEKISDPALIFDCDISVIKRAPSFAPDNFKFMPPAGLYDFPFEEEKLLSRTSTPSKPCHKSSSPVTEAASNDSPLMHSLPKIQNLDSTDASGRNFPDEPIRKEIEGENKIDNIKEEKLQKESGVNFSSGIADKVDRPNEKKSDLDIIAADLSLDIRPLEIDINKIKALVEKHKLREQDEELNIGKNNLPSDVKNEEPAKASEDKCIDSPFDIVDINKIEEISAKHVELIKLDDKEINIDDLPSKKHMEVLNDSPLNILDLSKMEEVSAKNMDFLELEEEELINYDQQDCGKYVKKRSCALPKRTSMLKNRPTLNSIAEISETDESAAKTLSECSKNKQASIITPRRSQRLSKLTMEENSLCSSAVTPRRSVRLQSAVSKKFQFEDSEICSPKSRNNPRRSMRLIDLNTPEKEKNDSCKTNLTADFQLLTLEESENRNPLDCLIDLDCSPVKELKSRKISLLYSPNKRKSIRKSIRGDLISFSPSS